jgi:hypothetical protein
MTSAATGPLAVSLSAYLPGPRQVGLGHAGIGGAEREPWIEDARLAPRYPGNYEALRNPRREA